MKYTKELISHFSHPQHKLKFEYTETPFKCDGCKEAGIGSKYTCTICDYDLHMHCAIPTSPSISHPFYSKCLFQFLARPPGTKARYCNACRKDVTGFVYHCHLCGYDLHPCCAKLPTMLDDGEMKLFLYRKVSSTCHKCGRKGRRSWSYRSKCKKYILHVACVKEMLVETWHEMYFGGRLNFYGSKNGIPSLKGTLMQNQHRRSKTKVRKCCEIGALALQFVISAVLGDPTTLIVGVVGSLMSK